MQDARVAPAITGGDHLRRRYRHALVVMLGGWLAGLSVFAVSYVYAHRAVRAAWQRAWAIWASPERVNPATLPELDRLVLLDLIEGKLRPRRKVGPALKLSAEEEKQLKEKGFNVPDPRTELVRQFLRVRTDTTAGELGVLVEHDDWSWLVPAGSPSSWSDEPGEDWWFVDPATGERTYRDVSEVEAKMEWRGASLLLAVLLSLPWLWYFLLARLREVSDAIRAHRGD